MPRAALRTGCAVAALAVWLSPTWARAESSFQPSVAESEDGGRTWRAVAEPPAGITRLIVHPRRTTRVFALAKEGILVRRRRGRRWKLVYRSERWDWPMGLVIDPTRPRFMLAATGGDLVVRSRSGGRRWRVKDVTWHSGDQFDLQIVAGHPSVTYFALHYTLLKSTDMGRTWTGAGGPPVPCVDEVLRIRIDPRRHGSLWTWVNDDCGSPWAIWRSVDHGKSWEPTDLTVSDLAFDGQQAGRIVGIDTDYVSNRVWRSDDWGDTWSEIATTGLEQPVCELYADPATPDRIFGLGCNRTITDVPALVETRDGGATWHTIDSHGLSEVWAFAAAPSDPRFMYVAGCTDASETP